MWLRSHVKCTGTGWCRSLHDWNLRRGHAAASTSRQPNSCPLQQITKPSHKTQCSSEDYYGHQQLKLPGHQPPHLRALRSAHPHLRRHPSAVGEEAPVQNLQVTLSEKRRYVPVRVCSRYNRNVRRCELFCWSEMLQDCISFFTTRLGHFQKHFLNAIPKILPTTGPTTKMVLLGSTLVHRDVRRPPPLVGRLVLLSHLGVSHTPKPCLTPSSLPKNPVS